jgi:hypothetical protein
MRQILLLLLVLAINAQAQNVPCGLARARAGIESAAIKPGSGARSADDSAFYIVPVVIHIIHNGGPENVPDLAVQRQIEVLNEDFGRYGAGYNNSPVGMDTRIRFCLATVDPDGKPATGIVRVKSGYTNLNSDNEMLTKNLSRWDQKRYLNIWVVKRIGASDNEHGYAYLAEDVVNTQYAEQDGIVINYKFFGRDMPFNPAGWNKGRTASHEVGHYFNLMHTWGGDGQGEGRCGDDDKVDDTPDCDLPYTAQYFPLTDSCTTPKQCGFYRMVENHMDYSEERCKNIFTKGQSARMREAIRTYRPGLVSYSNAFVTGCRQRYLDLNPVQVDKLSVFPNPASERVILSPLFTSAQNAEVTLVDELGRVLLHTTYENVQYDRINVPLYHFRPGLYIMFIRTPHTTFQYKLMVNRR